MISESRVRNYFKMCKNEFYARHGGTPAGENFNEVWLTVAKRFEIPVRQVKDIVYPNGWTD